jgi:hypothetical protein
MSEEPKIRKVKRIPIKMADITPSSVITTNPKSKRGLPGVNKLKNTVNNNSIMTAFNPFTIKRNGTFDSFMTVIRNAVTAIYPYKVLNKNSDIINKKVPINLTLGSNRCRMELVG